MATTRSSSSSKSYSSSKSPKIPDNQLGVEKQPKGYLWINNTNVLSKADAHELGHGASKTVYMSEYSTHDLVFDINEIQGDDFDYSKYAIARIGPRNGRQTFTDGEMRGMHDEIELQMEFAREGKATRILGLLLKFPEKFPDESFVVAYTEADILHQLTLTPNPRVCYILMERCNFVTRSGPREGKTKSIWDISKDPLKVVQQLIYCINHICVKKKMIFYDFKELNVCVSPDNEIIALDFDRHFCINLDDISSRDTPQPYTIEEKQEIASGYMFLLFACEYYKNIHNPDPKIIAALQEGINLFEINRILEHICRFTNSGRRNLEHYLIPKNETKPPSFVQYVRTNYLEPIEQIVTATLTKSTGRKTTGKTKGGQGMRKGMRKGTRKGTRLKGKKTKTKKRY